MNNAKIILIVGASRGLGHAMAVEFLTRGWNVIGTVRGQEHTQLHDLSEQYAGRVQIEQLDICEQSQIISLHDRLAGTQLDMLFVNAGTTNRDPDQTIGEVDTDDFVNVMVTNALSPMRVVESLEDNVKKQGLIGIMSSGQGSITDNTKGMREVYRGSKAALNMYMKCFAARQEQAGKSRALALIAPGWIKTSLGGNDAPYTMEETVPMIVQVLLDKSARPGLEYLDRFGKIIPW
ncbi:MAG: SDR family NAD(P)-dependent oxidoreductase [Desulfovibrio sp.]|uniref:SDR family NAD(P)-dependent oxidoreductase n=1 Tax=Desulfovibrio sp. 7SRBS1 TaxID=3378064 RepID=UPI003B4032B7